MRARVLVAAALCVAVGALGLAAALAAPQAGAAGSVIVTSLSNQAGPQSGGTAVSINGSGFVGTTSVDFGTSPAPSFTVVSNTVLSVVSPPGVGTVDVTVNSAGTTSATSPSDTFSYAPTISRLSPNTGPSAGGTRVSIVGTGFTDVTAVKFANTPSTAFTVNSATSISAIAPAGSSGSVVVAVVVGSAPSSPNWSSIYTYFDQPPVVASLSPTIGTAAGGTTVSITGIGFSGATAVNFGASPASGVVVTSPTTITAVTPPGTASSSVDVTVTGPGGTSAASANLSFAYGPIVTGVSPNTGYYLGGTTVTIKGAGFLGASDVDFAQTPATKFSVNPNGTQITATSPGGDVGSADITVTVESITTKVTSADVFTYYGPSTPTSTGTPVEVNVSAGSGAAGAINEDLIGLNHIPAGSGALLSSIGTAWARTDVSFETSVNGQPVYNCATGAWNPSYLDSNVANNRLAGASTELIIDYTPPCLATNPPAGVNPNYTPPDIGADQTKWKALVYQMALHEISTQGVRTFEVWNEPNGQFWVAPNKLERVSRALSRHRTGTRVGRSDPRGVHLGRRTGTGRYQRHAGLKLGRRALGLRRDE